MSSPIQRTLKHLRAAGYPLVQVVGGYTSAEDAPARRRSFDFPPYGERVAAIRGLPESGLSEYAIAAAYVVSVEQVRRVAGMKPRYGRRDANESSLLTSVEPLGGFWLPTGLFDGWLWDRRSWHLCEVKEPRKEGWQDEFTEDQLRLIARLNERHVPFNVLRTESDVLALLSARCSA